MSHSYYGAVGNHPVAVQAAQDMLLSGGSATSAVLSGFFAACGAYAGVLLGPLTLLVAGVGSGVRAFDGRLRQPGLGTKRPRGFTNEAEIPMAARVAVPQSIAAAVVAHAYDRGGPITEVIKRGIRQAKQVGSEARAEILERIRSQGAKALSSTGFARPLLHVAGVSESGLLTNADLAAIFDVDAAATPVPSAADWMEAPWLADQRLATAKREVEENEATGSEGGIERQEPLVKVLASVDNRGVFAAAAYSMTTNGVAIDELELEAPACAMPVMRGVTRIAPGCPIPFAMPIAVQMTAGRPIAVVCDPRAQSLDASLIEQAPLAILRDPRSRVVTTKGQ